MKKTFLFLAVVALLAACNNNRTNATIDDEAWFEAADSTGNIVDVYAYEGNIKAHGNMPAAHYMVVISEELDSINGTYTLTRTYIVADTVKQSHKSKGRKITHWGMPGNRNAKVYTLAPDSGSTDSVYLFVESDTTVVLLNNNKQQPEHPEHFRLRKK